MTKALLLLWIVAGSPERPVLTLPELLERVDERHPVLKAARLERARARGQVREADGAFDLGLKGSAAYRPYGYYEQVRGDVTLEQPTAIWGTRFYTGWRIGRGKFADYEGKSETNDYGEFKAGLIVPLLRGRATDGRRGAQTVAAIGTDLAELEILEKRIDYQLRAAKAYFSWVAAGLKLRVAERLLEQALFRDEGMRQRVEHGDLAPIEQLDNGRAILQRQSQRITAERALTQAALALSLYLVDGEAPPEVPGAERLPVWFPPPERIEPLTEATIEGALERRPDYLRLARVVEQSQVEIDVADNQQWVGLDFQLQVSRDFGDGAPSREPTELEALLMFDVPLQRRTARGKREQAEAKQGKVQQERIFWAERAKIEILDTLSALNAAKTRTEVAQREVELSRRLEEQENKRFELGDGSQLFVNIREQNTGEAELKEIDAWAEYHLARVSYRAAQGQLLR